jgi:predicted ATPase
MVRLALSLLGPLQITFDDRSAGGLSSAKVRALLIYLAVGANHSHPRAALAELLWPEQPGQTARHNLRQALSVLRQALGDDAATPCFLLVTRDTAQFNPASATWLDVAEFTRLLDACDRHGHDRRTTCTECAGRLAQAAALYRGSFLDQFALGDSVAFEEWALVKREALHRRAMQALADLAAYHELRGEDTAACAYARQQLAIEPWHEDAHRRLMRLLAQTGQRAGAVAQYARCRQILAAELGIEPEPATAALYERIRTGALQAQADTEALGHEAYGMPALAGPPAGRRRHNLPQPLTPFVGRQREIAELSGLIHNPAHRLITILGPGGLGKTALAVEVARWQTEAFADGVWFVSLAPLQADSDIAPAIANALDVQLSQRDRPEAQLIHYLRDRSMLLVLDNFEQVLSGAEFVASILREAPHVRLLATSREALGLLSETPYYLKGLDVPEVLSEAALPQNSAVELFVQIARRAQYRFAPDRQELLDIAAICRTVQGMPLAIVLAASWTTMLAPADILAEIGRSYDFLEAHSADLPKRLRSIRLVFTSVWDRLNSAERRVCAALSVFRGGFTRTAAQHVAGATLPVLKSLVNKSLLQYDPNTLRYDMHELLRQYAGEQLDPERVPVEQRHADYYLTFVEQAERDLFGADQLTWARRIEADHANVLAALYWLRARHQVEPALRLSGALGPFWQVRSHLREGKEWLEATLALSDQAIREGDGSRAHLEARARVLHRLGYNLFALASTPPLAARARFEQAYDLYLRLGDEHGQADALIGRGLVARSLNESAHARTYLERGLALARKTGYRRGMYWALHFLAGWYHIQGEHARAELLYDESLALARERGDLWRQGFMLSDLARLKLERRDFAQAHALYRESLLVRRELEHKYGVVDSLVGLACLGIATYAAQERIALLLGAAEGIAQTVGIRLEDALRHHGPAYTEQIAGQRRDPAFAAAWSTGRAASLEQAIAEALRAEGSGVANDSG